MSKKDEIADLRGAIAIYKESLKALTARNIALQDNNRRLQTENFNLDAELYRIKQQLLNLSEYAQDEEDYYNGDSGDIVRRGTDSVDNGHSYLCEAPDCCGKR